eukprot:UN23691
MEYLDFQYWIEYSIRNSLFPQMFFSQKMYLGSDRMSHSEQLFPLELLLKMRSYSSGNRRMFGKMSDIFAQKPYF